MNSVKESEITMASVEKFSAGAVRNQLRHNRREIEHSGNPDIDPSRQGQDYVLSPDRGICSCHYKLWPTESLPLLFHPSCHSLCVRAVQLRYMVHAGS